MECAPITVEIVTGTWLAHEQATRPDVPDSLRWRLPARAGSPSEWRRCRMWPEEALGLVATWQEWRRWCAPGDTFSDLARHIIDGRTAMPSERVRHIEGIGERLGQAEAAFEADPVVLSGCTRPGHLAVVEGNHRIAAVCLDYLRGQKVGAFWVYLGA